MSSPLLRINSEGKLVGKHWEVFGSTDRMRQQIQIPRPDCAGNQQCETRIPPGVETDLGVDFCLTWSLDPRWALTSYMQTREQGWTPCPTGNPPRGEGGAPAPPRAVGRGGFPAPPGPVKMIKTAGKLRGKIKAWISTFSKRGNKWWNNITTLNNVQSSLSIGYARESKKWK